MIKYHILSQCDFSELLKLLFVLLLISILWHRYISLCVFIFVYVRGRSNHRGNIDLIVTQISFISLQTSHSLWLILVLFAYVFQEFLVELSHFFLKILLISERLQQIETSGIEEFFVLSYIQKSGKWPSGIFSLSGCGQECRELHSIFYYWAWNLNWAVKIMSE